MSVQVVFFGNSEQSTLHILSTNRDRLLQYICDWRLPNLELNCLRNRIGRIGVSLLTEDGLLAVPTTSKEEDALMEIEQLISDHGDLFSDNLAVSEERNKRFQRRTIR